MQSVATNFASEQHPGGASVPCAANVFGPEELRGLQKLARTLAGAAIDPDDLLHDALERALRSFDAFEQGSNLFAWMRTIMYRLAIDQTRGRRRRKAHLERERWALVQGPTESPDSDDDSVFAQLGMEDIRWALAQLPDTLRRNYHLFAIEGLSYYEIGRREGVPFATVGTRLLRARRKLRELLSERARQGRAPLVFPVVARTAGVGKRSSATTRATGRGRSCGKNASLAA
jgi:RNA polymerase sigma-70 factor, ECF subfamily